MRFIINNILYGLVLVSSMILSSNWVLALTSDNNQPIHINSIQQSIDLVKNTVIITGKVVVKRGSIDIRADKVIITRSKNNAGCEILEVYGDPATFYQMQDDGKPIRGHSQKVCYDTASNLIILTGEAYLEQLDNNVQGDHITYIVEKQQIQAFSDKGKQVITVLVPVQLQDTLNNKIVSKPR